MNKLVIWPWKTAIACLIVLSVIGLSVFLLWPTHQYTIMTNKTLYEHVQRIHILSADSNYTAVLDSLSHLDQLQPQSDYQRQLTGLLYVHLTTALYQTEEYQASVRSYEKASEHLFHLDTTTRIRVLRWVATSYTKIGDLENASLYAKRSIRLARSVGNAYQEDLSVNCLLSIPDENNEIGMGMIALISLLLGIVLGSIGMFLIWMREHSLVRQHLVSKYQLDSAKASQ